MFMVCLRPMPYKANSPWQHVCVGRMDVCYETRFMNPPNTNAVHHPCKPKHCLTQPWRPVSKRCTAWRGRAVLRLKQIQLTRGSRFVPSELCSTLNIYIWMELWNSSIEALANHGVKALWSLTEFSYQLFYDKCSSCVCKQEHHKAWESYLSWGTWGVIMHGALKLKRL